MTQHLTEALVEAAREAARNDAWDRDQIAWNLPRNSSEKAAAPPPAGLDWVGFSETYHPGSRRHDLRAIVAYAAYKRSERSV